jgi:hypothetical protein
VLRRRALLAAALVTAALVIGGAPAMADEPTPTPTPTTVLTPSLSPPSQQQIDDAKAALERLRTQGKNNQGKNNQGKKSATPTTSIAQVAGPTDADRGPVASRISDEAWWTLGAGLLLLVVASETTRLGARRAKHRKGA